jgi:peptide deformylase
MNDSELDLVFVELGDDASKFLRVESKTVHVPLDDDDRRFADALLAKHVAIGGVGLAAPQVGVHKRVFVYGIGERSVRAREQCDATVANQVLCNADYERVGDDDMHSDFEACFSVRDVAAMVPRLRRIKLTASTVDGEPVERIVEGFEARVLQHEIDHLRGTLIVDRVSQDCLTQRN